MDIAQGDRYLLTALKKTSQVCSFGVVLIGCFVLLGWVFDIPTIKSILPQWVTMKANAALGFVFAGLGLYFLQSTNSGKRRLAQGCALFVTLLGLLNLSQYAFGWNLGIDQLLFTEKSTAIATSYPGRMAAVTAFNFTLMGIALWLLLGRIIPYQLVQILALVTTLITLQVVIGYIYGAELIFELAFYTFTALHTAIAFLILSLGILFAAPEGGWMSLFVSNTAGGITARVLIPAAVAIPFILGWLQLWGERIGWFDEAFGLSLHVTGNVVAFLGLTWYCAHRLAQVDLKRQEQTQNAIARLYQLTERTPQGEHYITTNTQEKRLWDFYSAPLGKLRDRRKIVMTMAIDITDRKQAEADLQKYQDIFQFAEHALAISRETVIELVNPAFARMHGYTVAELIGKPILELFPPESHAQAQMFMQQVNETGHLTYESEHLRKDGTIFPVFIDITVVKDEWGNILYRIVNVLDITERYQAEVALRESEARARARAKELEIFLEAIPVAVWIAHDRECHVMTNNRAAYTMMRRQPGGIMTATPASGEYPFDFKIQKNGVDIPPPELPMQTAARTGESVEANFEFVFNDGEVKFLDSRSVPLFDDAGNVRGVIGAFWDVSELQRAEERFRATFNQAAVGIAHVGLDGRWLRVNQKLCDIIGYSHTELIQKTFQEITYPEDLENDLAYIQKLLGGEIQTYSMEKRYLRKDGSLIWIYLTASLVRQPGGIPDYFISVIQDISARKAAELAVKQLNETLEQRVEQRTAQLAEVNQELKRFAYSVSHDLRSPLRAIRGLIEALVEDNGDGLDELGHEYARHIADSAQRMDRLIQDLLAYSRLSQTEIQLQIVDLTTLVSEILQQLEPERQAKQAEITIAQPLPQVIAQRTILTQVLINLLTNSLKYVAPGVKPQIEVWAENRQDWVRIWVTDNGIGIEPEFQERIFGVFERLHSSDTYSGTGVGLAIVQKGIERLGGRVGVESELGKGSRFWLELRQG
ncbi:diguanylate cyclase/phosphodiesterase with PAS/PAC sensor(s) [Calothrix brevissima NIES-22]|nr:diguanylate cyclase/phosphodiesterase with PAS/PAC sensor(s) [Calothrix brevissima NIES-22]